MKIGVFTDDFYPIKGGQGKHIYELYKRFPKGVYNVYSPCNNDLKYHTQLSVPFYKKFKNITLSIWLTFHINKIIEKDKLDRINIHSGPGGLFLLKKSKVFMILTCHHTYWQQSNYINSEKWKRIFIPLEKKSCQLADKIICVSRDTQKILVEKYNIDPQKTTIIPNGVDTKIFHKLKKIRKITNSVLYIGRIDKRKGVDFLIKSFVEIVKVNPEAKLFLGGKGRDLEKLKSFAEKNKMVKHIEFLGFIPENELNRWYNRVKCLVVPSMFEGFGITVIEAMAAGTPVIGTDVDGIRTIIRDAENGFLVKYGNSEQLVKAIKNVLNRDNKDIIDSSLNFVKNEFNWNIITKRTMEYFK